jgi:peptidoglycan/LPS O-acetylase OafA/YrhL
VALLLVWLFLIIRGRKNAEWRILRVPGGNLAKLALLWIAIYVAFLFFWLPHNTFYRLFYLPAIILLLGEILAAWSVSDSGKRSYRLALFVVLMALANFLFFIFPYSHAEKYPPLSAALEMNKVWQPGTIVFYGSENSDNNLFQYFNRASDWKPLPEIAELEAQLSKTNDGGKEAWLESTAIDQLKTTRAGEEWFARHAQPNTLHERRDRGYNIRFIKIVP